MNHIVPRSAGVPLLARFSDEWLSRRRARPRPRSRSFPCARHRPFAVALRRAAPSLTPRPPGRGPCNCWSGRASAPRVPAQGSQAAPGAAAASGSGGLEGPDRVPLAGGSPGSFAAPPRGRNPPERPSVPGQARRSSLAVSCGPPGRGSGTIRISPLLPAALAAAGFGDCRSLLLDDLAWRPGDRDRCGQGDRADPSFSPARPTSGGPLARYLRERRPGRNRAPVMVVSWRRRAATAPLGLVGRDEAVCRPWPPAECPASAVKGPRTWLRPPPACGVLSDCRRARQAGHAAGPHRRPAG